MIRTAYRCGLAYLVEPRSPLGCTVKFVSDGKLCDVSPSEVTIDKAAPMPAVA